MRAVSTLLVGLLLLGCGARDEKRTLVITGSSTVAPLMTEIARRFESQHAGVRIDVQTGGSSRGVADARSGVADIGMASRAANDDEKDLHFYPIARDGVAVILHANNAVQTLDSDQIRKIYRKEITNWSQVGGSDAPITVVNKAEGRSTLELFLKYFELESAEVKPDVVIGDNVQGIKTVAGNPDAIGYVSIGTAEYEVSAGTPIKMLRTEGIAPSTQEVLSGRFPLSRPLNLVTKEDASGVVRELIDFAGSAAVHDLVKEQYFVPLEG
jgi:phosphate transport system substrate-binding protein